MLIIDRNYLTKPLPIYEVQEVSVKQALILLTSRKKNIGHVPFKSTDDPSPATDNVAS